MTIFRMYTELVTQLNFAVPAIENGDVQSFLNQLGFVENAIREMRAFCNGEDLSSEASSEPADERLIFNSASIRLPAAEWNARQIEGILQFNGPNSLGLVIPPATLEQIDPGIDGNLAQALRAVFDEVYGVEGLEFQPEAMSGVFELENGRQARQYNFVDQFGKEALIIAVPFADGSAGAVVATSLQGELLDAQGVARIASSFDIENDAVVAQDGDTPQNDTAAATPEENTAQRGDESTVLSASAEDTPPAPTPEFVPLPGPTTVLYVGITANLRVDTTIFSEQLAELRCGERIVASGAVQGQSIEGNDVWFETRFNGQVAFIHSAWVSGQPPEC